MDRYVPDWRIDPPEDNRKVFSHCQECGEPIKEREEVVYAEYLGYDFCDMDCFKSYLGVENKYYENN